MNQVPDSETLERIQEALEQAADALSAFVPGMVKADYKSGKDPVTEADRTANRVLREALVRDGEGWLSEESTDDLERSNKQRVWVVDPLDGTLEFVAGIPEWCISVGLVENGRAVAGGICNPATGETFVGEVGKALIVNGKPARASDKTSLEGALVLASRSEVKRGEWQPFQNAGFVVRPTGSIAYKLALVAAGFADATWTLSPKNEWDIAAGVALVEAGGGFVRGLGNSLPTFNNKLTLLSGLVACGPYLRKEISSLLEPRLRSYGSVRS
jgi:myo-inositol-1(or 4)-monophosphatase